MSTGNRRTFLTRSALALGTLPLGGVLAGCGGGTPGPATSSAVAAPSSAATSAAPRAVSMTATWWGNPTRHQLMQKVFDAYIAKHSLTKITGQPAAWAGYWDQLAVQAAGGAGADWIMMDQGYLAEYADRGALADLDPVASRMDLSGIPKGLLDGGRLGGKLFVVPLATNTQVLLANQTLLDEAKVTVPSSMTWDKYADICRAVTSATGGKSVGSTNRGGSLMVFESWLRGHGKELYGMGKGELTFGESDVAEWFEYWQKLQREKVVLSADAQATLDGSPGADNPIITRACAFEINWTPQWTNFQGLTKEKVQGYHPPAGPQGTGQFLKAANYFSASAKSKNVDEAAKLTDFLLNDLEATKILGSTLGIPASSKAQAAVAPNLSATDAATLKFHQEVEKSAKSQIRPWARGHGRFSDALIRTYQEVTFGRRTVSDGAKALIAEARSAIS